MQARPNDGLVNLIQPGSNLDYLCRVKINAYAPFH